MITAKTGNWVIVYSDDHGKNWQLGGLVRPKANECQLVETYDGRGTLLLNIRSYYRKDQRTQSISTDGGATWGPQEFCPALVEPLCQASFIRHDGPGRKGPKLMIFSNPAASTRVNMTVRASEDGAKTWPRKLQLFAGPSGYSCLASLDDDEIGCLFENGEARYSDRITFARFAAREIRRE
jgi:sialidase-1